jgi:uncharacterized heparinase superfamily protein
MKRLSDAVRFFHTVRYIKPIQIVYRGWYRLYRPRVDLSSAPDCRERNAPWVKPIAKPSRLASPWQFTFLAVTRDCHFPADWNNSAIDKLWLYNLHYFDELQAGNADEKRALHRELLCRWMAENPVGVGNGWEPYPLSLRIVNWVKWLLAGNTPPEGLLCSLAVQVRWLKKRLEYHLLGNHLFANAKALVFAGLYFGGEEGEEWLRRGMAILQRQIPEQILDDGGHFERSPMYHCIILEDMLDMANLFQAYGREYPALWREKIAAMLGWLGAMVHPDGQIGLFNDAAFAIAARPVELFAYAARLGFGGLGLVGQVGGGLKWLQASGYIRRQSETALLLLDVGEIGPEYLPGHAHADTLSFEMSVFGKRVIVDSGTSCYGLSAERLRQRGTAAHNTVTVDGEDSSEVWSGFRVARRARPVGLLVAEGERARVRCSHDGYRRLKGKVGHTRCWEMAEREVVITDSLEGKFAKACGHLHFHPEVRVVEVGPGRFAAALAGGEMVHIEVVGGVAEVVGSSYHPEFGVQVENTCIRTHFDGKECVTRMRW